MNSLRRTFFCSLIVISYIELHPSSMRHVVDGVAEVELFHILERIIAHIPPPHQLQHVSL